MQFKDAQFLSAAEKLKVFRAWQRFLKNGLKQEDFSKSLYEHLHLHCSFIAHYDRGGFYATYFEDSEDVPKFFQQFDKDKGFKSWEYGGSWLDYEPYSDINKAMCEVFEAYKKRIYAQSKTMRKVNIDAEIRRLQAESAQIGPVEQQQNITEVMNMSNGEEDEVDYNPGDDSEDEDDEYSEEDREPEPEPQPEKQPPEEDKSQTTLAAF